MNVVIGHLKLYYSMIPSGRMLARRYLFVLWLCEVGFMQARFDPSVNFYSKYLDKQQIRHQICVCIDDSRYQELPAAAAAATPSSLNSKSSHIAVRSRFSEVCNILLDKYLDSHCQLVATFWLIFSSMEDTFISAFLSSAVSLAISRPPELCLVASRSLALKIFQCFNKNIYTYYLQTYSAS